MTSTKFMKSVEMVGKQSIMDRFWRKKIHYRRKL